jgi:glycosyltransferase involved in cell wall biosynthesis
MRSFRVLVVTNLWPSEADPGYGSFVQAQMESLRPWGVEYQTLFINGRASRWNYVRAVSEVRRTVRNGHFDLIHAHFGLSGWVARLQRRVPVVVSFMGDDVLGRFNRKGRLTLVGRLFRISSRALARRVAAVIVKSLEMKQQLGWQAARVIPNGVDLDLFRPLDRDEARRQLGLSLEKRLVLFPYDARTANKRYDVVEAAVTRARASVPEIEILNPKAEPRERMPLFFNAADVLVLASHSEGSPNAVKEAMAVNLPVVSVDVGDVRELLAGTEGCYIVRRDVEELAAKIVEVCRRPARPRGRERAAGWSMENAAQAIVEVYAQVAPNSK